MLILSDTFLYNITVIICLQICFCRILLSQASWFMMNIVNIVSDGTSERERCGNYAMFLIFFSPSWQKCHLKLLFKIRTSQIQKFLKAAYVLQKSTDTIQDLACSTMHTAFAGKLVTCLHSQQITPRNMRQKFTDKFLTSELSWLHCH